MTLPGCMDTNRANLQLQIQAGDQASQILPINAKNGIATMLVPFTVGNVSFKVLLNDRVVLDGVGASIGGQVSGHSIYNFNAWTGSWGVTMT